MLRYFTDTQTGIQTATTDSFRQINPIFLFLRGCKLVPRVIPEVASSLNDSQMRPMKVRLKSLLDVPSSDNWHFININPNA